MKTKIITGLLVWAALLAGGLFAAEPSNPALKNAELIAAAIKTFDAGKRGEAFTLLKLMEDTGDLRILSRLGMCYLTGAGVEQNQQLALQYFRRSVDDPDGFGTDGLAICYAEGIGVEQDLRKAGELHRKAMAMGNKYAAGNLAKLYGKSGDLPNAIRYWEICYHNDLPPFWKGLSAAMLGQMHQDPGKKLFWMEKAVELEFYDALEDLANFYHWGIDTGVDMPKALDYARQYAERTGQTACYAAAAYDWAIEKLFLNDRETAATFMRIAAENGDKRAYWYAFRLTGDGKYALAAAENGDERGCAEAGVWLMNHKSGDPERDAGIRQQAEAYYRIAAVHQDVNGLNALCNLAALYVDPQSPDGLEKALELYQQAAIRQFPRGLRGTAILHALYCHNAADAETQRKHALTALENLAAAAIAADQTAIGYMDDFLPLAVQYQDTPEAKFFNAIKRLLPESSATDVSSSVTASAITPDVADVAETAVAAEAMKEIRSAADDGCMQAVMLMGINAAGGIRIPRDDQAAVACFRRAAAAGNLHAKWLLGADWQFQEIVPAAERMMYLQELTAAGDRDARNAYARLLQQQGQIRDAIQEYRTNAAAGDADSMMAHFHLLLEQNNGMPTEEMTPLLHGAVEQHNGTAQCIIGYNGINAPDAAPRIAMHFLMKGIIDGADMPETFMHQIAMQYANGNGVTRSAENARAVAQMMIDRGLTYGYYTMGELCRQGASGKADPARAAEYFRQGAAQGDPACAEALKALDRN